MPESWESPYSNSYQDEEGKRLDTPMAIAELRKQESDSNQTANYNQNNPNAIDQIKGFLGSLFSPQYNTRQADAARNTNVDFTRDQTSRFLNEEERRRSDRADSDLRRQIYSDNLNANRNNAIANSNLSRQMALGSQNTLNDQYRNAADRLNTASRDINSSLNQSASTIASLFR